MTTSGKPVQDLYDLIVASPNAALDSYYIVSQFQVGNVNRAERSLHTAGGKGINLSRAVVMMGGRVLSLGILGGHTGSFISSEMQRENIPYDMVLTSNETRRSATFISSEQMQVTVILDPGSSIEPAVGDQLIQKVKSFAPQAPYLVLTGSLPPSFPSSYYAQIVREVRDNNSLKICLDCSGETMRLAVENGAHVIKVNLKEFQETFSVGGEGNIKTVQNVFHSLVQSGVELLIVTDGPNGAYIFSGGGEPFRVYTEVKKWVSTIGAGDTYLAALLLAFNRGLALEEATCFASAAASAKLQQVVCGSLLMEDLNSYLPLTHIHRL